MGHARSTEPNPNPNPNPDPDPEQPLRAIGLGDVVKWVSASGEGSGADGLTLPPPETRLERIIDIEHHPHAQTHVARATLRRLAMDVEQYARDQARG